MAASERALRAAASLAVREAPCHDAGMDRDAVKTICEVLPGAEVVATFEDGTPAIVTTPRTMYIAPDTSPFKVE